MPIEQFEPDVPISCKKLAARWGVEPTDIFFIMLNHDLHALSTFGNRIDVGLIIEGMLQSEDNSSGVEIYIFSLSDVLSLEEGGLKDFIKKREKLVRGKALIEKWKIEKDALFLYIFNGELTFVDPFGFPIKEALPLDLFGEDGLDVSDFLFRPVDIEKFEKEYGHLLSIVDEVIADRSVHSNEDPKQSDTPSISFYRRGDRWMIGKTGQEKILNHLKGFDFINFLIRHEGKDIDVNNVYNLGQSYGKDLDLNTGYVPEGLKVPIEHSLEMIDDGEDERGYSLFNESVQEILDGQTIEETEMHVEFLKQKELSETDPQNKIILKENIEQLEKYIKDAKTSSKSSNFRDSSKENCRINVRKRIKTALDRINKLVPDLKETLNEETITTGHKCCYKPNPKNPVEWILDPEG